MMSENVEIVLAQLCCWSSLFQLTVRSQQILQLFNYSYCFFVILAIIQNVVHQKGINVTVTNGLGDSSLSLRNPEQLSYVRAVCTSPEVLDHYFDILKETLDKNDLSRKPCQKYNYDETGMPLDQAPPKVIAWKGQKHTQSITTSNITQITVLSCYSASGYVIPPMIVFDRKTVKAEVTVGEVPGSIYGLSESGWVDGELFDLWFRHHFLSHTPPLRLLLLLLDGHSSHYTLSVINKAAEEGIIVLFTT